MNILVTICARGGSKGIPGKNIKLLNGIPLIAYTIKTANSFCEKYNADITLSTDSPEIRNTAGEFGLKTSYIRPAEMATDLAGKVDALVDVMKYEEGIRSKEYDFIVDFDVTSPLRTVEDVESALTQLLGVPDALNIFSVSPANRNPYFNMVEKRPDGYVEIIKNTGIIKSRQTAPVVYDMNASFYIFRKRFFTEGCQINTTHASLAYVVPHMCFDLDNPIDFTIMEIMLKENLLDFQL